DRSSPGEPGVREQTVLAGERAGPHDAARGQRRPDVREPRAVRGHRHDVRAAGAARQRGLHPGAACHRLSEAHALERGTAGRPRQPRLGPGLSQFPAAIFDPSFGDVRSHSEERTNNLFGVDAELRLRNLDRYFMPMRDLRLYAEYYWDDTCGACGPSSGIGHFFASNFYPNDKTPGL